MTYYCAHLRTGHWSYGKKMNSAMEMHFGLANYCATGKRFVSECYGLAYNSGETPGWSEYPVPYHNYASA